VVAEQDVVVVVVEGEVVVLVDVVLVDVVVEDEVVVAAPEPNSTRVCALPLLLF
jgi:hypothetical protein